LNIEVIQPLASFGKEIFGDHRKSDGSATIIILPSTVLSCWLPKEVKILEY
jgi:hypothetical protein